MVNECKDHKGGNDLSCIIILQKQFKLMLRLNFLPINLEALSPALRTPLPEENFNRPSLACCSCLQNALKVNH